MPTRRSVVAGLGAGFIPVRQSLARLLGSGGSRGGGSGGPGTNPPNTSGTPFGQFQPLFQSGTVVGPNIVAGTATLSSQLVWYNVSGNITFNFYSTATPATTLIVEYLVDGAPSGSGQVAYPGTWVWDSTTVPNGTHLITLRVVSSTTALGALLSSGPALLLVNNSGGLLSKGPQLVPVAKPPGASYVIPIVYSAVQYGAAGTPSFNAGSPSTPHPYPTNATFAVPTINGIPPAWADARYNGVPGSGINDPDQLRSSSLWYVEAANEPTCEEYESNPQFLTTQGGGVFVGYPDPQTGGAGITTQAYDATTRHNDFDGLQLDSVQSPFSTFVELAAGGGFLGVELNGRLSQQLWDGSVTTLCGWRRDRTGLSYDPQDLGVSEGAVTRNLIGTFHAGISDIGGANDLCYDPRDNRGAPVSTFTGSIAGTTLTIPGAVSPSNTVERGQTVTGGGGGGCAAGTIILQQLTGTPGGGSGATYKVNQSQTVSSGAMTAGNSAVVYVISFTDHKIAQIDLLGAPDGYLYAGIEGTSGHTNNANALLATFNSPTSLQISSVPHGSDPVGTVYVADYLNHAIRKVLPPAGPLVIGNHGAAVSDLVFGATEPVNDATYEAAINGNVNGNIYSPAAATAFASCYAHYAFCLRWTSANTLVYIGAQDYTIRQIDLTAQTMTRVNIYDLNFAISNPAQAAPQWQWLGVDRTNINGVGVGGRADDFIMVNIGAAGWQRMSLDGSYKSYWANGAAAPFFNEAGPPINSVYSGGGHYPWAIEFASKTGRIIMNGIGTNTSRPQHIAQVGEPNVNSPSSNWNGDGTNYGLVAWSTGTAVGGIPVGNGNPPNFHGPWPFNLRPSFHNSRGPRNFHHLGCFATGMNTMDDLYALSDGNPALQPLDAANSGTLIAYIQQGMGALDKFGNPITRYEFTGRDAQYLIYNMRRFCHQGSYPTPVAPPTYLSDFTDPVITNVTATRVSSTGSGDSLLVTWDTNKPTIGFAMACAANQVPSYNVFSPVENNTPPYKTAGHSVTVTGIRTGLSPIHWSIVAKDLAGNSVYIADQTIT